jgi:4-hydroxy-3-methylbut-2-enyl diphosphate reductase
MRRSIDRQCFPISGVEPGEIVVATTLQHPVRGTVRCPAAPVLVADLRLPGRRIRRAELPPMNAAGDGVARVVSYLDPDGRAVGLGIAVHRSDDESGERAAAVLRSWTAVLRTRRLLVAASGPSCTGLDLEATTIQRLTDVGYLPLHLFDPGPERNVGRFSQPERTVRVVETLGAVPDGATVVFPAHGVGLQTRAEAAARGAAVVDATCPLVARVHAATRRFADEGNTVVVIGGRGHAAVQPNADQAPEAVVVACTVADVEDLVVADPDRVAFVIAPGLTVAEAAPIVARLRQRFGRPRGQHPDEWCYAATDRQATVRAVAGESELTLVLGDPAAGDTHDLVSAVTEWGGVARQVAQASELRCAWLDAVATVGVVVGTSARRELVGELTTVLSGLGPLSVARRRVTTEITHDRRSAEPAFSPVVAGSARQGGRG